jgi:hypothetical protein
MTDIGEIDESKLDLMSSPDCARGKLQRICLALLREHHEHGTDGIPTNNKFLGYELVQRGVIEKRNEKGKRRGDTNMHEALMHLRETGIVPWLWLDDETRKPIFNASWSSLTEWATTAVEWERLNPWKGRPPKILTETRAVAGVLRDVTGQFCVDVFPTGGQCGGFLRTVVAPELEPGDRVFYAGDLDLSGGHIEANTRAVLERLIGGELDWTRIALTEIQVDKYKLRKWAIWKTDRRYTKNKNKGRHLAVECEALKQHVIVKIVRDQLNALLPEPLEDVLEREARQRRRIAAMLTRRRGRR